MAKIFIDYLRETRPEIFNKPKAPTIEEKVEANAQAIEELALLMIGDETNV